MATIPQNINTVKSGLQAANELVITSRSLRFVVKHGNRAAVSNTLDLLAVCLAEARTALLHDDATDVLALSAADILNPPVPTRKPSTIIATYESNALDGSVQIIQQEVPTRYGQHFDTLIGGAR